MNTRTRRKRQMLRERRRYRWRHPLDCRCLLCHDDPIFGSLSGYQLFLMSRYLHG